MIEKNELSNMSYTNKDFQTIYPELLNLAKKISYKYDPTISNETDPGVMLLKLCAIIADKNNYNIDKNVLECFPISVTQDSNARQLFEQLGYNMGWYKSSTTKINMRWIGESTKFNDEYINITLPRFTMVTNSDSDSVYTLIDETIINTDGSTASCNAIQGIIKDLEIGGSKLITVANIDSDNRVYFDETNIAENGIFIMRNDGMFGDYVGEYGGWKKVNNLSVEELGKTVYKFGVTNDGDYCYIEFPDDVENIIGDGLTIKYIITDGADGNIASRMLTNFYGNVFVNILGKEKKVTSDDIELINQFATSGGENPETIDEAYKNYKKTVGTFNTLVTLRDYTNAINLTDFVANSFVCDRTNDIQCSYKVVTFDGDITKRKDYVEKDGATPKIDAFGLKLYALQYVSDIKDYKTFSKTFGMLNNFETNGEDDIDPAIQDVFGYIDDTKCIQHDFEPLLKNRICFIKNYYPLNCKIIPQYKLTDAQANEITSNVRNALYNNLNSKELNFGDEISYDFVYNTIMSSDERIKAITLDNIEYSTYAVYFDNTTNEFTEVSINSLPDQITGFYNSEDGEFYKEASHTTAIAKVNGKIYTDKTPSSDNKSFIYENDAFVERKDVEIQNEIFAKSVLNGNTQIFTPDTNNDFEINLQQKYSSIIDNIKSITTNVNVALTNDNNTYIVRDNEHIVLYTPNTVEKVNYSTYVKYQYNFSTPRNIASGTEYTLAQNESITFYWSDTEDAIEYKYRKYGAGTIIKPSFNISGANNYADLQYVASSYPIGEGAVSGIIDGIDANTYLKKNVIKTNSFTTATRSISILENSQFTIEKFNNICYWVLNNVVDGKYVLFENGHAANASYILKSGEYFIYTDESRSALSILGSGTKISLSNGGNSEWSVPAIDYSKILEDGASALKQSDLFVVPSDATIIATEMKFIALNSGSTLKLSKNSGALFNITLNNTEQSLSDYIIEYKDDGDSSFTTLAGAQNAYLCHTVLDIVVSKDTPQTLVSNQSFVCSIMNSNNTTSTITVFNTKLLSDYNYLLDGGININVTRETLDGEKIYMKLYEYVDSETSLANSDVKYNSDGSINISYDVSSIPSGTSIDFNVPSGEYILTLRCLSKTIPTQYNLVAKFKIGDVVGSGVRLKQVYNENSTGEGVDFSYNKKIAYLKLVVPENTTNINIALNASVPTTSKLNISIDKLFKYTKPILSTDIYGNETQMTDGQFDAILSKMFNLDTNNDYVYTYVVNKDEEIKNPLEASSFLNDYHIMNKYTICQMSSNSGIEVTNKIK